MAGACLLFLPAFASAEPSPARHGRGVHACHASRHGYCGPSFHKRPAHKHFDDQDSDSDDVVGDTWIAPCALTFSGARHALITAMPDDRRPAATPPVRSFTAIDPFAPRPPPARFLL